MSLTNPIFVMNQSGHVAYVNSIALEIIGITAETAGVNYQVIDQLTGVVSEDAVRRIASKIGWPKEPEMIKY